MNILRIRRLIWAHYLRLERKALARAAREMA